MPPLSSAPTQIAGTGTTSAGCWVVAIRCHSASTFSSPRYRKRFRPLTSSICPFTGSKISLRWALLRLPFLLLSLGAVRVFGVRVLGQWAPLDGKGWQFRLELPPMDPDVIASQLRINQLGGSVQIHPKTGELMIGALYRDPQTGQWHFDQSLADAECFGADADSLDSIREYIACRRRSGRRCRPAAVNAVPDCQRRATGSVPPPSGTDHHGALVGANGAIPAAMATTSLRFCSPSPR